MAQLLPEIEGSVLADRALGNYWSAQFGSMMNTWYAVHKFDKAPSPIVRLPNGDKVILADVLLLERNGENYYCEVKHKKPNRYDNYGLEEYRAKSLQRLQEYAKGKVLYVIHDHALAGGKFNQQNNIHHWRVTDITALCQAEHKCFWGESIVDSIRKRVPIWYWPATLWLPLQSYFFGDFIWE